MVCDRNSAVSFELYGIWAFALYGVCVTLIILLVRGFFGSFQLNLVVVFVQALFRGKIYDQSRITSDETDRDCM